MSVDPAMLQQLLQQGGPGGPDIGGMGMGGAPPGMGAPPPDPASNGPPPDPAAASGGSTSEILQQMIDLAKSYLDTEQDQEDLHTMTKVLAQLQSYLAREQKEEDGMMQGKMSPKAMRSAYSG